ncbi:MAG: site-specific DNA-methyltransferase [Planctomycetaceae bacterium]|jgi:DNA modification methylase|nr:site-specific DNA-methyltransferase [Planctomycetaceae bacterium]
MIDTNILGLGDAEFLLSQLPEKSVHLIFTSPPYFNARPECCQYDDYMSYLKKMQNVILCCRRVLSEGRYFILNSSPVIIPRSKRNRSSKRLGIPFDLHQIIVDAGFDFIDDVIWVKPEGAGCGRGRDFARYRTPLHYKTVPITEYVMVYRKHTDKLLDWNIRNHPNQEAVMRSKIDGDYEKTNVWKIPPATKSYHPAPFPLALAERIIRYYSIENDVVLDPFAGSGTTGTAAALWNRKFILIEKKEEYFHQMRRDFRLIAHPIQFLSTESGGDDE